MVSVCHQYSDGLTVLGSALVLDSLFFSLRVASLYSAGCLAVIEP